MSPHILPLLLCLVPACAMALPTDSLSIVWKDSTQLQISFPLSAGDARPGSDYRLFVTPRLCSAGGDTLNLSTVEFAGTRNKKYNDRAAHLAGQARPTVYRADETMTYQATVPVEPWMKQGELTLSLGREREGCCNVETLPVLIYRLISSYDYQGAAALGTLLLLQALIVFAIGEAKGRKNAVL